MGCGLESWWPAWYCLAPCELVLSASATQTVHACDKFEISDVCRYLTNNGLEMQGKMVCCAVWLGGPARLGLAALRASLPSCAGIGRADADAFICSDCRDDLCIRRPKMRPSLWPRSVRGHHQPTYCRASFTAASVLRSFSPKSFSKLAVRCSGGPPSNISLSGSPRERMQSSDLARDSMT